MIKSHSDLLAFVPITIGILFDLFPWAMKKYLSAYLIFIVSLAAVIFLSSYKLTQQQVNITWMIFIYFCVITLLFHIGIVKTTNSRPQVFIRYYMGATTMKLLLHLGIIILYAFLNRPTATFFIVVFMIMYLLFTVFEVRAVWRRT